MSEGRRAAAIAGLPGTEMLGVTHSQCFYYHYKL